MVQMWTPAPREAGDSRSEIQNQGVAGPQTSPGRFAGDAGAPWASRGTSSRRAGVTRRQTSLSEPETPARTAAAPTAGAQVSSLPR